MEASVRVRYAPSPTGEPHVGNIRTALFNWLFAQHHSGSFILRIEDTDQTRQVTGALDSILSSLRWLGLNWDEGPQPSGVGETGQFGPYIQSKRLDIYQQYADQLLANEMAYKCYCSQQRLDSMRAEQRSHPEIKKGYDRHCLGLTEVEKSKLIDTGTPHVLRFRVPDTGSTSIQDEIRGLVEWANNSLDDFVLLKSDGFPTYHLANVVDDHLMKISHVLRAEEWLPSTPRHILLYSALGWQPPYFGHLPMILGPDRSKLSKRHGATSILEYRQEGFLDHAMINFLALLGWSLDDQTDILPVSSLVEHFSLARINKSAAIFNKEKLEWMNGVYIRSLEPDELALKIDPFLQDYIRDNPPDSKVKAPTNAHLLKVIPLIQDRVKTLAEGPALFSYLFGFPVTYNSDLLVPKGLTAADTMEKLTRVANGLHEITCWKAENLESFLRALCEDLAIKPAQLLGSIRVSLTGKTATPPLFQTMEVLGKTNSLRQIRQAIDQLKTSYQTGNSD